MKILLLLTTFLFATPTVYASNVENVSHPLFGEYRNSISFSDSFGIRYAKDHSIHNFSLQYNQPNTIFRLPGRINLEGIYINNFKEKDDTNSVKIIGVSQDAVLYNYWKISVGGGLGIYIKDKKGDTINSRFTFGEKAFLNYTATKNVSIELLYRHFSNGDVTETNHGYNFAGLGLLLYY